MLVFFGGVVYNLVMMDFVLGVEGLVLDERVEGLLSDARFERYFELLSLRNAEFNLTAIVERGDVWVKHFADSLVGLPFVERGARVLDVGSGAGFPALPLKIARDDISLTLVESVRKKAVFLREAVEVLGLSDVEVENARVEDLTCFEKFDCGVARAVAKTATLCEYILPFLRVGGVLIAYKARDAEAEAAEAANAIKTLGGKLEKIHKTTLGGMERNLIIIRKIAPTPPKYPRKGNKPKLAPL